MTTRAADSRRSRSRRTVTDEGTTIVLGDPNVSRTGFRPELPPVAGNADARFSLAADTEPAADDKKLGDKVRDVWQNNKGAILAGAAILVVIALARKR
jgi:hypothetical protein